MASPVLQGRNKTGLAFAVSMSFFGLLLAKKKNRSIMNHAVFIGGYGGTADTLVLGASASACGFKSHCPHQTGIIRTFYRSVKGSDFLYPLILKVPEVFILPALFCL